MQSPTLQFSSNGQYLAVADEGVTLLGVSGAASAVVHLPTPGAAAVAAFADQVWVLDGDRRRIMRFGLDGRAIGTPFTHSLERCSDWCVAPIGAPAVVLDGSSRVAVIDDLGELSEHPAPASGLAIPISGRRHVICEGRVVRLGSETCCRLGEGVRALAGAALFDGTAIALAIERAGDDAPSVIVLSTANGRLQQGVAMPPGELRIAARRGVAIAQVAPRRLVAIDLRFGRTTNSFDAAADIDDFAVDADAVRVAVRSGGALRVHVLRDWSRAGEPEHEIELGAGLAAGPVNGAGAAPSDEPSVPAIGSGEIDLPTVAPPPLPAVPSLGRLGVRPASAVLPAADAARLLDRELQAVGMWALVAVAEGWDTRRIGYPNESAHPFEMEVAAILGLNAGHARDHLAAARDRLAAYEAELASIPDRRALSTPLGALVAEFGLSALALDLLLVAAAPSMWGDIARLYGVIANDPGRALVDEVLLEHVIGGARASRHEIARELTPAAPLVRFGLVQLGARQRPFASITVDPVVLARLRGEAVELGAGAATTVRPADRALADVLAPRELVLAAIRYLARDPGGDRHARFAVRGRAGSGRRTLLASLAAAAGRDLGVIDVTHLPRRAADHAEALRVELRRALVRGLVPCVSRLEDVTFDEQGGRELIAEVLREHPGPITLRLAPGAAVPFEPGHFVLDLPMPSEGDRLAVWRAALAEHGLHAHVPEVLAARYRVGPGTILGVTAGVAQARADEGGDDSDATPELELRLRQTREVLLGEHAHRVERLATWSSLVLPPDVLDSLRELIGRVRHRRTVYERWGFDRTMATSRGLTALFQGPPGTGKTMVAGIIARELGLDLYQVDLSKVMSKWLGETERNLGAIFDAAEDGQVVLLFDEADSLFAKRTEVKSSHDRYANLEVNYLLQRLDAFEGIAILTTNFGGSIDPAFKRRLSFRLSLPFPDEETREQLWRAHLPPELPVEGALDLAALAKKYQLAGGYIRNACLRAAFLAAQSEVSLSQHHLERAVALEFSELGKLSTTGPVE